jgi:hypothetical protein
MERFLFQQGGYLMKKIWKNTMFSMIMTVLFLIPMGSAYAGDKTPPQDPNDFITISTAVSMPGPIGTGQYGGNASVLSAGNPAPGGGTLTAYAGVQTGLGLIRGYAESQLSPQVLLLWTLCGQVNYLKRNGVQIDSKAESCAYLKAGGSSKVVNTSYHTNPHGTFTVQTYHQFIQAGGWPWKPTVNFSTTLP